MSATLNVLRKAFFFFCNFVALALNKGLAQRPVRGSCGKILHRSLYAWLGLLLSNQTNAQGLPG